MGNRVGIDWGGGKGKNLDNCIRTTIKNTGKNKYMVIINGKFIKMKNIPIIWVQAGKNQI